MREILFRGKRISNGKWIEGYYEYDESGQTTEEPTAYIYHLNNHPCGWFLIPYEVIPETVGQYTGLTDKNGKKIFEGDILEFSDRLVVVFWHAHLGCWDSNFLKYTNKENGKDDMSPSRWDYKSKVIGNIHDNPELLNETGCESNAE